VELRRTGGLTATKESAVRTAVVNVDPHHVVADSAY
jgi:hypothetical protein